MYPSPQYKTKIVAGKLVTVPIYPSQRQNFHNRRDTGYNHQLYQHNSERYGASSDIQISINARVEAQKNKERALAQTYRSVLSPEPSYRNRQHTVPRADILTEQLTSQLSRTSRHKLLSAISALRRLDPEENGILSFMEIQEMLGLYNIALSQDVLHQLFHRFQVSGSEINYNGLWKHIMDCYVMKDKLNITNINNSYDNNNQCYLIEEKLRNDDIQPYTTNGLRPGLKSELEFELRQYARTNQLLLDTRAIQHWCIMKDKYATGKVLSTQMYDFCNKEMIGVNMNIMHQILRACDTDNNGLVDFNKFFQLIGNSQPTYLPPITRSYSPPPVDVSSSAMWRPDTSYGYSDSQQDSSLYLKNDRVKQHGGNHEKLENLGGLALHLSDFETNVVTKKSPVSSPDLFTETQQQDQDSAMETYTVNTPEPSPRPQSSFNTQSTPSVPAVDQENLTARSPQKRSPSRRKWQDSSLSTPRGESRLKALTPVNPRSSHKIDKWWKHDLNSSANSGRSSKLSPRKGWGQSKPVKSIKAKRKRKNKKFKQVEGKTEDKTDENVFLTSTEVDSEVYTTTDIEVVVNDENKPYTIEVSSDEERNKNKNQQDKITKEKEGSVPVVDKDDFGENDTIKKVSNELQKLHVESVTPLPEIHPHKEEEELEVNGKTYQVYPCSTFDYEKSSLEAPEEKLQLEWIHGFSGNPIHTIRSGELISFIGRVVVLMDTEKRKQRFYRKHSCDITSLCIHQDEVTVASAERKESEMAKCMVYIWNAIDLSTTSSIFIDSSEILNISTMDFQKIPDRLILGMILTTSTQTFCRVYDCQSSLLTHSLLMVGKPLRFDSNCYKPQEKGAVQVVGIKVQNDHSVMNSKFVGLLFSNVDTDKFVTYERNQLNFCEINGDSIDTCSALFGDFETSTSITSAAFNLNGQLITGSYNGSLYVWENQKIHHAINTSYEGPVLSILQLKDGILLTSCSRDRTILAWNKQMKCMDNQLKVKGDMIGISSIAYHNNILLINTNTNILYTTKIKVENCLFHNSEEVTCVLEGTSDIVTSICNHPSYKEMMITLSADGMISMYNIETRSTVWTAHVKGNGSVVCFHQKDEIIFVGTQDGSVHMLSSTTGDFIERFKHHNAPVTCMQPSADGVHVLCGMNDGMILLYQYNAANKDLELLKQYGKVCGSSVEAIDWSTNNDVIRIQSMNNKLIYLLGSQVCDGKRDTNWFNDSCMITYEMKGALRMSPSNDFQFSICRRRNLLAYHDHEKQLINLLKYPCLRQNASSHTTPSCGSDRVKKLCFSNDGQVLFMSLNNYQAVWQWKVVVS